MKLTHFGKRVMAAIGALMIVAVISLCGYVCLCDKAYRIHLDQQAFNVLFFVTVLPILCYSLVSCIEIIRHGRRL